MHSCFLCSSHSLSKPTGRKPQEHYRGYLCDWDTWKVCMSETLRQQVYCLRVYCDYFKCISRKEGCPDVRTPCEYREWEVCLPCHPEHPWEVRVTPHSVPGLASGSHILHTFAGSLYGAATHPGLPKTF